MSLCAGEMKVLCRRRQGWNRQSGDYTELCYEGTRDAILGLIADAKQKGAENWDIDHEGPKYTAKIRFANTNDGATESSVDEVRFGANRESASIYNHPSFTGISFEGIQTIRSAMQNNETLDVADFTDDDFNAGAFELYDLVVTGVTHFIVNQPVLVRRWVASSSFYFSQPNAYVNVNRIIGVFTIDSDAQLGGILRTVLPTDTTGTNSVYAVGWLKHFPEYTNAAGNKAVLTQEYEFGKWSRIMYGDPL